MLTVPKKFNFGTNWKWFIPEIPKTTGQLLSRSVFLMVIIFVTIVDHSHDIWIVVFVVIVKRVKKYAKSIPTIRATKYWTFKAFGGSIPGKFNKNIELFRCDCFPIE